MRQLSNQAASASRSGVKVRKTRTGSGSRSGGTATTIASAPISMPAALAKIVGKPSIRWVAGVERGRDIQPSCIIKVRMERPALAPRMQSMVIGVNQSKVNWLPPVTKSRVQRNQDAAWARTLQWARRSQLLVVVV